MQNFREIGAPLALVFVAILALQPTPISRPLASSIQAAQRALDHQHPAAALEFLEHTLTKEPALAALNTVAAQIALDANDPERARTHLQTYLAMLGANPLADCLQSRALLALGDVQDALQIWQSILPGCPQPASFWQNVSQVALANADRQTALQALRELNALEPDAAGNLEMYGLVLATQHPEEALPTLRRARGLSTEIGLRISPLISAIEESLPLGQDAYTLAQVGQSMARAGQWTLATWAFGDAIALEPQYAEAHAYLGLAREQAGGNGLENLRRAVELAPTAALPRVFLAYHWLRAGQPEEARLELETAAGLDPGNPAIAVELGRAYTALGDLQAAKAATSLASQIAPQDPRFWRTLAQFSIDQEIEVATLGLPAARNTVVLAADDATAWDLLGYAHVLLGNSQLADRALTKAIQLDPTRASTQFHLGLLRQLQGNTTRAQAAFLMATYLDPSGVIGQMAVGALDRSTGNPASMRGDP